ncbi:MAG: RHS repeat-associated core domain-containing protein [Acidobacteria bacterium]|nr:RHS repeat-associated core domain-containing protein [Acidobacteriota bacterium]
MTFVAPDGTEYNFADQYQSGVPRYLDCGNWGDSWRGNIFIATDGSGATFVSQLNGNPYNHADQHIPDDYLRSEPFPVNGCIMLKDGTRYEIVNGKVVKMRDRNGNEVKYEDILTGTIVVGLKITDSLNREIRIDDNLNDATYGYHDKVTIKGYGGADRITRICYAFENNQWLRTTQPTDPTSPRTMKQLFPKLDGVGPVNGPLKVAAIVLPNGKRYRFWYNVYCELARVELPTGGAIEYDYEGGGVWFPGNSSMGIPAMFLSEIGDGTSGYDIPRSPANVNQLPHVGIHRRLRERRLYKENATLELTTTYSKPNNYFNNQEWTSDLTVEQRSGAGVLMGRSRHCFYGSALESSYVSVAPYALSDWREGKETKTETLSLAATPTPLRQVEQTWEAGLVPSIVTVPGSNPPVPKYGLAAYPRIAQTKTTLNDSSQVACQTFTYDGYNNQTEVQEFDFGTSATPGPLVRRTVTAYVTSNPAVYNTNYATDNTIHLRNLPASIRVYDASNNMRAETLFEYDLYDASPNHAALVDRPNISCLNPTFTTSYKYRGNVTKIRQWIAGTTFADTCSQYDIAGNVVKAIDANGNATMLDYADNFGIPNAEARTNTLPPQLAGKISFAFPSKVTNALNHIAYTQYDYCLGGPVDTEDPNGIKSSLYYNEALDRPTQERRHATSSTAFYSQTSIAYDDTLRCITVSSDKDIASDNVLMSKSFYDGLGRTYRSATYEGSSNWAIAETQLDGLGRVAQVSNPYRATNPNNSTAPANTWTITTYDALSRVFTVQTPNTAAITTTYNGNAVTVADPAGKQRRSLTDALGRLIRVDEPNSSNSLGTIAAPTQPTSYAYDALGNLRKVAQGGQERWFAYDALSRLIYAKNPEQTTNANLVYTDNTLTPGNSNWSLKYVYDANGNLTAKTDARNITLTYVYDLLNRNTTVDYSNTTLNPDVRRFYDSTTITNGKGRFSHDYYGDTTGAQNAEHKAVGGYDALGRPLNIRQQFKTASTWSNAFTTAQTYDLSGNVRTVTYPSSRVVNYAYNMAGQLTDFTGKLGGLTGAGGADVNYATAMQYNPRGQMMCETFGTTTALYQRKYYNRRGQLFDIRLGTDGSSAWNVEDPLVWRWANGTWNRGALRLYYSASLNEYNGVNPAQADNNGNIHRMEHFVPNALDGSGNVTSWTMGSDGYSYDELSRLTQVVETPTGGTGPGFTQKYLYDRWGNRRIDMAATSTVGGGVTRLDFKALTANNRLVAQADTTGDETSTDSMRYDKAGNLVYDNFSPAVGQRGLMSYDAENRMVTAVNGNHQYSYNADGTRTRRLVQGQVEQWLVYGVGGELVAEYDAGGPGGTLRKEYGYRSGQMLVVYDGTLTGDDQLKWLVTDHLGSTRMLVNRSGSLGGIQRRDYLPFGEELASTIGHRNASGAGYVGGNNPRQKFGTKERDNETGLDYFLARYYSSVQGRFTSPDEFTGGPTELFAAVAAHNPTFYADLFDPQSLNKYSYCLNNPLKFIDPDGHQATVSDRLAISIIVPTPRGIDSATGIAKSVANVLIGANNIGNEFGKALGLGDSYIEPYQPSNSTQDAVMHTTDKLLVLGSLLGGAGPANVMTSQTRTTVAATAQTATAGSSAKVQSIVQAIGQEVKAGNMAVKVNPKNAATSQEANVTLQSGNQQVNLRTETHPLKPNGPPVRHVNVQVTKKVKNKNVEQENTHIDQ